jgi:hypothetical protein
MMILSLSLEHVSYEVDTLHTPPVESLSNDQKGKFTLHSQSVDTFNTPTNSSVDKCHTLTTAQLRTP